MMQFKIIRNIISKEDCMCIVKDFEKRELTTHTGYKAGVYGPHQNYYELESAALLHHQLTPFISKEFDKNLGKTYCYTRKYKRNSVLTLHRDREHCEYGITIHLKSSDENVNWPFYLIEDDKKIFINLKQGDCLLYKGTDIPHGREGKCPVDDYVQVFMHWVDLNGNLSKYAGDTYVREKKNAHKKSS